MIALRAQGRTLRAIRDAVAENGYRISHEVDAIRPELRPLNPLHWRELSCISPKSPTQA